MKNEAQYIDTNFMAAFEAERRHAQQETVFDFIAPEDQSLAGYVICGYTKADIALIFGTSSRNVEQRLQHIFKTADHTTNPLQFMADAYGPVRWTQLNAVFELHGLSLQEGRILQLTLHGKDSSQIRELTGLDAQTIQDGKASITEKLALSSFNEIFAFVHTYPVPDTVAPVLAAA